MADRLINPFIRYNRENKPFADGSHTVFRSVGSELDKDTGTVTPVIEEVDIYQEIQACQNMCGLELMKTLLAQGKAKPEDFYDDGRSGVDVSSVPSTVHEAQALAEQGNQQFAELAKALGIEDGETLNAAQLEKALTAYIAKAVSEQTKAAPSSEASTNE